MLIYDSPKACWLTDGSINLPESAYYDMERNDCQIQYTPLRLNKIFKEAGFKKLSFEIYFHDSEILMDEIERALKVSTIRISVRGSFWSGLRKNI